MRTLLTNTLYVLTAGLLLAAAPTYAQDTPPAKTSTAPAAKASQTPATGSAATKTGQKPAAKPGAAAPVAPKTQQEKASYAIGANIGKGMKKDGVVIDTKMLSRGLNDAITGKKLAMTDEEMQAALTTLSNEVKTRLEAEAKAAAEANKKVGEDFLAANKTKDGVVTLPSGLQYKILTEGTGPKPTATDQVVCNYRGSLIDGTEFDNSYKRGQPATFPVDKVIKGWTEALQLMPVGSKWQLFIPSNLAYGERGAGQRGADVIPPNSALIFEVELVSIKEKQEVKPQAEMKPSAPAPTADPKPQTDAKPQR